MQKIMMALLVFWNSAAFSGDLSELVFYGNADHPEARSATFSWDLSRHICKVQQAAKKLPQTLKESDCKDLDQFLLKHARQLKELDDAGMDTESRRRFQGEHLPLARIEVNKMKFAILKTASNNCNAQGKNCRPSSTLACDQLGFIVLRILDKTG